VRRGRGLDLKINFFNFMVFPITSHAVDYGAT